MLILDFDGLGLEEEFIVLIPFDV